MRSVREPAFWEFRERLAGLLPDWGRVVAAAWIRESERHNHARPTHGAGRILINEPAFRAYASAKEPTRFLVLNLLLDRILLALAHGATPDDVVCALGSLEDPLKSERRHLLVSITLEDLLRL